MKTINFQPYSYVATATFDCPCCGKTKRTRSFRSECTVNPFNTKPDGHMRNASEVRAQSRDQALSERLRFMSEPLCASCENNLSRADRKSLHNRRASSLEAE